MSQQTDFNTQARKQKIKDKTVQIRDRTVPLTDTLDPYYQKDRYNPVLTNITLVAVGLTLGMTILAVVKKCDNVKPVGGIGINCEQCHGLKVKMTEYFQKNGVKSPQQMAEAVLKTRNPRLLAAWNVGGEKKTPHTAMKTGYKGGYSGAWQTAESWGKVTKKTSIADQAIIAELALETHVKEEKDIIKGLNALGGESDKKNGKFAYNVLRELEMGGIP